ncbi:MAG: transposase [Nitrospirales bacterium]
MAGVVAQLASNGGCRYNGSGHTTHTPSDTVFVTGTIIIRPSLLEAVVVKSVYHLSLWAAQGFVSSVMRLLRLDLPGPNYSTISP